MGKRTQAPQRHRWITHAGRAIYGLCASVGAVVLVASLTPLDSWWATRLAGPWNDPGGDVLIVLGGSLLDDGQVGGSSYWRCIYGAKAYRDGGFRHMVITGGGKDAKPIALAMQEFMVHLGVPGGAIETETKANSTRENALFTQPLIARMDGRKVLLTSDYHMFRAYRVFRKAGIDVTPRPFPDVRKRAGALRGRWPAFIDLMVESVKIGYYEAHGWI